MASLAAMQAVSQLTPGCVPLGRQSNLSAGSSSAAFAGVRPALPMRRTSQSCRKQISASAIEKKEEAQKKGWKNAAATLALTAALQFSGVANASDFDVLREPAPTEKHFVDDAGVLSRISKGELTRELTQLEKETGYHIDVVTTRKLQARGDVFEYADNLLEKWYPTLEQGDKKGVVVLITTAKEGAVAGGPAFNAAVGDTILESIATESLPILAADEKYNEATLSSVRRLMAAIKKQADPGAPQVADTKRISNFKTKEETNDKRGQFTTVVVGLLVIAFVVPMVQYFGYVRK